MQILAQAHWLPGFLHADRHFVFLEDIYEDDGWCQHILVHCGTTPVEDAGLDWANVGTGESECCVDHFHLCNFAGLL